MIVKIFSIINLKKQKGFSLMEVMIALTIFAMFAAVYVTSQGYNISSSELLKEELLLAELCENKLNEIIIDPPELKESLTMTAETGKFENHPNYQFSIQYKRFKIPDLQKITGGDSEDDDSGADSGFKTKLMDSIKKNMEEILWQVEVSVTNTSTNFSYQISSWLLNPEAKVDFTGF